VDRHAGFVDVHPGDPRICAVFPAGKPRGRSAPHPPQTLLRQPDRPPTPARLAGRSGAASFRARHCPPGHSKVSGPAFD